MEGKKLPAKDLVGPFLLPLHRLSKQEVGGGINRTKMIRKADYEP